MRDIKAAGADAGTQELQMEIERLHAREGELLAQLREGQKRVVLEQAKYGYLARKAENVASVKSSQ